MGKEGEGEQRREGKGDYQLGERTTLVSMEPRATGFI